MILTKVETMATQWYERNQNESAMAIPAENPKDIVMVMCGDPRLSDDTLLSQCCMYAYTVCMYVVYVM